MPRTNRYQTLVNNFLSMSREHQYQVLLDNLLDMSLKKAPIDWLKECKEKADLLEDILQLIPSDGYQEVLLELIEKIPWAEYAVGTLRQLKQTVQTLLTKQLTPDQFKEGVFTWCEAWLADMERLSTEYLFYQALAEAEQRVKEEERRAKEEVERREAEERRAKEEERRAKEEERRAKEALAVKVKELEAQLAARESRGVKRTHTSSDLFSRKKAREESSSEPDEISSEVSHAAH